jgi:hypothetical protein
MIKHHEGAVDMVEALTEQPGSAYEPALFEFTRDVTNDQNAEIERMNALLVGLSADPRANLKAGFADAGEAILNLTKVTSLPKPPGFFDPANPANLPPKRLAALAAAKAGGGDGEEDEASRAAATTATRVRRCCRSRTRTSPFATTSWSSAAITASTSTGCRAAARRNCRRRSSAPAGRATSRSSATC